MAKHDQEIFHRDSNDDVQPTAPGTPLPTVGVAEPTTGALTDGSGTITTGGTSQEVFPANTSRRYLFVQNNSAEALWINFGGAANADQPSIQLPASGDSFVMESGFISTEQVQIVGATTGSAFTAKEG